MFSYWCLFFLLILLIICWFSHQWECYTYIHLYKSCFNNTWPYSQCVLVTLNCLLSLKTPQHELYSISQGFYLILLIIINNWMNVYLFLLVVFIMQLWILCQVAMVCLAAGMLTGSVNYWCILDHNLAYLYIFPPVLSIGGNSCCRVHVGRLQTRPYRDGSG